jgi:Tfp pilus assembly protein PilF
MSLIMDAQKAAQREKDRKTAGTASGNVPLLVPLRSKGQGRTGWQRPVLLVFGGISVVATGWYMLVQSRNAVPRALRTPGPTLASIATPQTPAAQAPRQVVLDDKEKSRVVSESDSAPRTTPPVKATPPPVRRNASSAAGRIASGRPRSPAPATANTSGRSPGQLVIEVERPRAAEVARLLSLGVAAHRAGDAATARAAYEQVLALAPNDVDALNNLGVLLTGLREFDRAEAFLRRAIALAPSNAGAWNNLGSVLRERARPADAIAAFQHALALDPHHAGARVGLAQQYLVIGSLAQARQLLEDVLRDSPNSPEANYALGQVLERQGDRPGAIRAYTAFTQYAAPALAVYVESVRLRIEALTAHAP